MAALASLKVEQPAIQLLQQQKIDSNLLNSRDGGVPLRLDLLHMCTAAPPADTASFSHTLQHIEMLIAPCSASPHNPDAARQCSSARPEGPQTGGAATDAVTSTPALMRPAGLQPRDVPLRHQASTSGARRLQAHQAWTACGTCSRWSCRNAARVHANARMRITFHICQDLHITAPTVL